MKDFIGLTATVDGQSLAVRKDAVRLMEDAQLGDDKPASTRVMLVDGTSLTVLGTVEDILKKLETL